MEKKQTSQATTCMDDYDPHSLIVGEALSRIRDNINVIGKTEILPIQSALNRVLTNDVCSSINVPPYTNSAMDGYAINGSDLPKQGSRNFKLSATVLAGNPTDKQIQPGECARIMTGAKLPDGTDTVIMQEHVTVEGDQIIISNKHTPGQNVRHSGEDIAIGETILTQGKRLTAADLGLLASLGVAEVQITRKVRVAFFSTGDELVNVGESLKDGQIYDSNRYTLRAMLQRFGADQIDLGIIKDNRQLIEDAFESALTQADVLITSGGVSVGDADYVKETLEKLGDVNFWKIAMKPGRPLAFGTINQCLFFGLPGNPVSTMVTFYQFVLPALQKLEGETTPPLLTLKLRCTSPIRKIPGRMEFQRGIIETSENGEMTVKIASEQGSHILSSMSKANCFIILPMDFGNLEANSMVSVQPFAGLI